MISTAMRFALSLTVAAGLAACAGPQQTTNRMPTGADDSDAPLRTTQIIVTADTSTSDLYQLAGRVLQSGGYGLANSSSELQSLTTTWRSVETGSVVGVSYDIQIQAGVTNDAPARLRLSGQLRTGGRTSQIQKMGQSGSTVRSAWADLYSVAYRIAQQAGGKLRYSP